MIFLNRICQFSLPEMVGKVLISQIIVLPLLPPIDLWPASRQFPTHPSKLIARSGKHERNLPLVTKRMSGIENLLSQCGRKQLGATDSDRSVGIGTQRLLDIIKLRKEIFTGGRDNTQTVVTSRVQRILLQP